MIVFGLGKNLLFKSVIGHCVYQWQPDSCHVTCEIQIKTIKIISHLTKIVSKMNKIPLCSNKELDFPPLQPYIIYVYKANPFAKETE